MDFLLIGGVALLGAMVTFFSGFGLGTVLLPIFVLFFPPEIAVLLTAVVHLFNNLFKVLLVGKSGNGRVVFGFGLPAIAGALAGASLLANISNKIGEASFSFTLLGNDFETNSLNILIGVLMLTFALLELLPITKKVNFGDSPNLMIPGGLLSGFFGGLSGHQGAIRSVFLLRMGLGKEAFVATGIGIALMVDFARVPMYLSRINDLSLMQYWPLLSVALLSAFAGAVFGKLLLKKITIGVVHWFVGLLIMALGIALALGLTN